MCLPCVFPSFTSQSRTFCILNVIWCVCVCVSAKWGIVCIRQLAFALKYYECDMHLKWRWWYMCPYKSIYTIYTRASECTIAIQMSVKRKTITHKIQMLCGKMIQLWTDWNIKNKIKYQEKRVSLFRKERPNPDTIYLSHKRLINL